MALLLYTNVWIYIDRGVLPGAEASLTHFIRKSFQNGSIDAYFGMLSSVYIAGYAIASFSFGRLAHFFPRYQLVAAGLGVWCTAVALSAICSRYWHLLVLRGLSGMGEASFQVLVAPIIADIAPPGLAGAWLAAFYAAVPVGTALGYIWGSVVSSAAGWKMAFALEAPWLAPVIVSLVCCIPSPAELQAMRDDDHRRAAGAPRPPRRDSANVAQWDAEDAAESGAAGEARGVHDPDSQRSPGLTTLQEMGSLLRNKVFMLLSFGYAAQSWTASSFGLFAPHFMVPLGLLQPGHEAQGPIYFGIVVALAGLLGTVAGGVMIDRLVVRTGRRLLMQSDAQGLLGGEDNADAASLATPTPATDDGQRASATAAAVVTLEDVGMAPAPAPPQVLELGTVGGKRASATTAAAPQVNRPASPARRPRFVASAASAKELMEHMTGPMRRHTQLLSALWVLVLSSTAGMVLLWCAIPTFRWGSLVLCLLAIVPGSIGLFVSLGAINLAIMSAVPEYSRPLAIGISQIVMHGLGDVPGPALIGELADWLAPLPEVSDDATNPADERDPGGLMAVVFVIMAWMGWCVLCWGLALCRARQSRPANWATMASVRKDIQQRQRRRHPAAASPTVDGGEGMSL